MAATPDILSIGLSESGKTVGQKGNEQSVGRRLIGNIAPEIVTVIEGNYRVGPDEIIICVSFCKPAYPKTLGDLPNYVMPEGALVSVGSVQLQDPLQINGTYIFGAINFTHIAGTQNNQASAISEFVAAERQRIGIGCDQIKSLAITLYGYQLCYYLIVLNRGGRRDVILTSVAQQKTGGQVS
jgi:hypothetical protein